MKNNEIKKILEIAVPSLLAWIGHAMYSIVDNVMVSKILGTQALAITGMATSIYFILLVFGMGASSIVVALVSESVAKNSNTAKVTQNSLLFCTILGLLTSCILAFGMDFFVPLINKQEGLNEGVISFLAILIPGPTFILIFFGLERMCEGVNRAKFSLYSVFICNIINVVLNYGLIKGEFGFPQMGVNGASLGSVTVSFCEVVIILILIFRDKITKKAMKFKLSYFSKKEIIAIASLGIPGGFIAFSESVAFNVTGFFASKISMYDIASFQLLMWGVNLTIAPIFGLAFAVTARIAFNMAQGKKDVAFKIGFYSIVAAGIYILTIYGLLNIFKTPLISLAFKGNEEDFITIGLMISAFALVFGAEISDAIQIICGAILRGYKDVKIPMVFALISYWGLCVPLSYYFGVILGKGVSGIWFGIFIGLTVQVLMVLARFFLKFKPKKLHLSNLT